MKTYTVKKEMFRKGACSATPVFGMYFPKHVAVINVYLL